MSKRKYRWDNIDRFMLLFAAIFLAAMVFIFSSCGASHKLKTSGKSKSDSTASASTAKTSVSNQEGAGITSAESSSENGIELTFEDDPKEKANDLTDDRNRYGELISSENAEQYFKDHPTEIAVIKRASDTTSSLFNKIFKVKINGNEIESSRPIKSAKFNSKELQKTTAAASHKYSDSVVETVNNDVHVTAATETNAKEKESEGFPWVKVIITVLLAGMVVFYFVIRRRKEKLQKIEKIFPNV